MKNKYNYISAAERKVNLYRQTKDFIFHTTREWKRYVDQNSTGWKAVRLSGYLTGQGVFK